jgi:anti-sigma regulatory factor (Ser/Thr protein kinase)
MEVTAEAATASRVVLVDEPSRVGEARRVAVEAAAPSGFDEEAQGRLAIIVTELATNLLKHAGGGMLVVRALRGGGVEVLAIDRGPGISDVGASLQDGTSTTRTAGNGLGAIRRLSSGFDIYSRRPGGTVVLARAGTGARTEGPLAVGAICIPHPGEQVSGDGWDVRETPEGCRVMVADGLGHGPLAREAALSALSVFRTAGDRALPLVIEACHDALRATRGAAIAVAEVSAAAGSVRFAGVGNISAVVYGGTKVDHLVSLNGTAGLGAMRAREFTYGWPPRGVLILASDGLQTRWSLDDHPGLAARDPSVIAAVLLRDHTRGRDDATVVVVKPKAA